MIRYLFPIIEYRLSRNDGRLVMIVFFFANESENDLNAINNVNDLYLSHISMIFGPVKTADKVETYVIDFSTFKVTK